jgi:hypothetical protein
VDGKSIGVREESVLTMKLPGEEEVSVSHCTTLDLRH